MSLSDPNSDVQIWRYMSAHEFCAFFGSKFVPFRAYMDLLNSDLAERRIPKKFVDAAMNDEYLDRTKKRTFVSCWSRATHENNLMWERYARRGSAVTTTKRKLLSVLNLTNWKEAQEYPPSFQAYDVDYVDDDEFEFYSGESRISQVLCRKRKAFASESEVRILYLDILDSVSWKRYSDQERWLLVPIRDFGWIDGVYCSAGLVDWARAMIEMLGLELRRSDAG